MLWAQQSSEVARVDGQGEEEKGGAPTGNPTPRIALFVRPNGTKFAASYIVEECTMRSLS